VLGICPEIYRTEILGFAKKNLICKLQIDCKFVELLLSMILFVEGIFNAMQPTF